MTTDPLTRYIQAILGDGHAENDYLLRFPWFLPSFVEYLGWFIARVTGA